MVTTKIEECSPVSLARVGSFEGDLEKSLANFSSEFYKKASQSNIQSYGLFYRLFYIGQNPYLLNISHERRKIKTPEDYNTLLIVTSHSHSRNQQVAEEFQHVTGIDFQRPYFTANPASLANLKTYGLIFNILLDKPDEGMRFLRKLCQQTEIQ